MPRSQIDIKRSHARERGKRLGARMLKVQLQPLPPEHRRYALAAVIGALELLQNDDAQTTAAYMEGILEGTGYRFGYGPMGDRFIEARD